MPQTLMEMAKELVTEQIRMHHVPLADTQALLQQTHATLLSLHQAEVSSASSAPPATDRQDASEAWKSSINKHAVTCMECGETFKQLGARHLAKHDLDPRSYRAKYGIPRTQPLSARAATARRREVAQQIRPWEQAALKRTASPKVTAKAAKTDRAGGGRTGGK